MFIVGELRSLILKVIIKKHINCQHLVYFHSLTLINHDSRIIYYFLCTLLDIFILLSSLKVLSSVLCGAGLVIINFFNSFFLIITCFSLIILCFSFKFSHFFLWSKLTFVIFQKLKYIALISLVLKLSFEKSITLMGTHLSLWIDPSC